MRLSNAIANIARPEFSSVIQFGEGNFLRAFAEDLLSAGVTVVQPTPNGKIYRLAEQDGLYTLILRGIINGEPAKRVRIIPNVTGVVNPFFDYEAYLALARDERMRFIVSNTTEAGIAIADDDEFEARPPKSYPAKLVRLLFERYKSGLPGFIILPCELIDDNAGRLKALVMETARKWGLGEEFTEWVARENSFCQTLVDRIVTGYPRDEAAQIERELGYEDQLIDVGEPFGLWVIQADEKTRAEIPLSGEHIIFTDDIAPYKLRKVRMLNGAHTSIVAVGLLAGLTTVGEVMEDGLTREFLTLALEREIMPFIPLPADELNAFEAAIFERFRNPYNRHMLASIALNSISKFVSRVLPSVRANPRVPPCLATGLAALIVYYKTCEPQDDERLISRVREAPLRELLSDEGVWGEDISFMTEEVGRAVDTIENRGVREAIREVCESYTL